MLINKRSNISCIAEFQLQLNKTSLKREHTGKYLGIFLDENLKWCDQIQCLSLQLARCSGLFYKTRNFLPRQTLPIIYHSLIYYKLQYGILVWGTASKTHFRELMVRLNNIVRIITFSRNCGRMSNSYKSLYLLELTEIYELELAKFMFALHNNRSPKIFSYSLAKLESAHDHNTRRLTNNVYFKPLVNKNIGIETILYRGESLWGEIDMNIKTANWASFKMQYKKNLIESYELCIYESS